MSKDILLIQNIKIHNANALSSPYSIGFPAMTAWLGFMHALERKITTNSDFKDVKLTGNIVSCINMKLHTYKGQDDYVSSIVATRNPLDKDGKNQAFIEQARCDLEVSIAIECKIDVVGDDSFQQLIDRTLHTMKIGSGDIINFKPSRYLQVDNNNPKELARYLMPGFCLVSRQELIKQTMEEGSDAIDAILDYIKVTKDIEITEDHKVTKSKPYRKEAGWLVPIAIGFQGISELGALANTRDQETPHRFAESIVTLGEFKAVYNFETLEDMIWRYQEYTDNNLYICQNNYIPLNNQQESKL